MDTSVDKNTSDSQQDSAQVTAASISMKKRGGYRYQHQIILGGGEEHNFSYVIKILLNHKAHGKLIRPNYRIIIKKKVT
jgi:hypothetical protein